MPLIFDHPSLRLNLSGQPGNPIDFAGGRPAMITARANQPYAVQWVTDAPPTVRF
jgi:hypothetical protein